jgi:hypothetical protein
VPVVTEARELVGPDRRQRPFDDEVFRVHVV